MLFTDFSQSNERDILAQSPPSVIYAQLKFMWAKFVVPEERKQVLAHLCSFTSDLEGNFRANSNAVGNDEDDETTKLLARCHFKQGEWKNALHDRWSLVGGFLQSRTRLIVTFSQDAARAVINSFHLATQYDKTWYKAWHTWALVNFEVAEQLPVRSRGDEEEMKLLIIHVRQAIEGVFNPCTPHRSFDIWCIRILLVHQLAQRKFVARYSTTVEYMVRIRLFRWDQPRYSGRILQGRR